MKQTQLQEQITKLYQAYGSLVYRRCYSLLKNEAAAEDAMQEVFVRIVEKLPTFRREANPVTWIYRISTNICIDQFREAKKQSRLNLFAGLEGKLVANASTPESITTAKELVGKLLEELDDHKFQILVHHVIDDMSQEEIATVMGVSRKTVWSVLNQIQTNHREFTHD